MVTIILTTDIFFSVVLGVSLVVNVWLGIFYLLCNEDLKCARRDKKWYEEKYMEYMKKYVHEHRLYKDVEKKNE